MNEGEAIWKRSPATGNLNRNVDSWIDPNRELVKRVRAGGARAISADVPVVTLDEDLFADDPDFPRKSSLPKS